MSTEDNCHAKSDKPHFESSPKVDEPLDIQDAETATLNTKRVPSPDSSESIFEILKRPWTFCPYRYPILEDVDGQIKPVIRRQVEQMVKMSREDNSYATSDKQHIESSRTVDEPLDIQDAETETVNTKRVPFPVIDKDIFGLFKYPVICPVRGPLVECLGSILRPEERRQIQKWIKGVEYVDLFRGPTEKQEVNGGKRKKNSGAFYDGKQKKKVARSSMYTKPTSV